MKKKLVSKTSKASRISKTPSQHVTMRLPIWRIRFITLQSVGLLLCSSLGFIGGYHWLFDVFSNFRLQYTWIAATLILFCWLLKAWVIKEGKVALISALITLVLNGALIGQLYLPVTPTAKTTDLKVMFSNIFIYNNQGAPLLRFIEQTNPDVIAMAEVNDRMFEYYSAQLKDQYPYAFHKRHKRLFGVAIFSKLKPNNEDIVQMYSADALPSLKLNLTVDSKSMDLIVTHPYPPLGKWYYNQRNGQLLGLAESVGKSSTPTLVVGDFNLTPWSPIFKQVLEKGQLHSSMEGKGLQTSWPTWVPSPMRIPIDHGLYTEGIAINRRYRGPMIGSDHRPIMVELDLQN